MSTSPMHASQPADALPFEAAIDVSALSREAPTPVARALESTEAQALARFLGIPAIDSLAFEGALAPEGREGWRLTGRLTGRAVQSCVVTLEPVAEEIDAAVERHYRPPEAGDMAETVEIGPEDLDAPEPLAGTLDLAAVMTEALALALAPYPRHPDAAFEGRVHAAPGVTPLTDEAVHPFSGLAALRERLSRDGGE